MLPETIIKGDDVTFTIENTTYAKDTTSEMSVNIYEEGSSTAKKTWTGTLANDIFSFVIPGEDTQLLPVGEYVLSAFYTAPKRKTLPATYCKVVVHQVNSDIQRVRKIIDNIVNSIEKRAKNDVISYTVDGNAVTRNTLEELHASLAKWRRTLRALETKQRIDAGGKVSNQVLLSLPKSFR